MNQTTEIQITPDINAIMHNSDVTVNSEHNQQQQTIIQNIELYSYTLSITELRAFIDDVKDRYNISLKNKLGNHKYYFNMVSKPAIKTIDGKKDFSRLPPYMSFTMKKFNTNRKFSNIFGEDVATIKDRVEFFINNKAWYDEKGIPYTLGLLLSGNPGTGKTSTIKCLANETKRHIFNINFNNDITKQQLENLFFNEQIAIEGGMEGVCIPLDQRIYVFEDIDCQNNSESISRTSDGMQTSQIDLSFLLNLLDGVLELPGRIIIMTSNHPEQLDHALIRPGRIDIVANYTNCTNDTIIKMIEFFYNEVLDTATKSVIMELPPLIYTPAEVGKILFEHFGNMDGAINALKTQIKTKPIDKHEPEKPENKHEPRDTHKPENKSEPKDKSEPDMQEKATSQAPNVPFENNVLSYTPMVASYTPMSLTNAKSEYQPINSGSSYALYDNVEPLWRVVN